MRISEHPFFATLDIADQRQKLTGTWGISPSMQSNKRDFFAALSKAHPFVFDRNVTTEKMMEGRNQHDLETLVESFSLPFKNTLYLLTDSPTIEAPLSGEGGANFRVLNITHGYLISEITPEKFSVTTVSTTVAEGKELPNILTFEIDLVRLRSLYWKEWDDADPRMWAIKEVGCLLNLTNAISVKRIGVEKMKSFSVKSRGVNSMGYSTLKVDRLIYIADKVEYPYTTSLNNSTISWEWGGFWRGHWRAFYLKDDAGNTVKDDQGWNVVDYEKIGKDRENNYHVPGYTWVTEHTKGNPALADIKNRVVKHQA